MPSWTLIWCAACFAAGEAPNQPLERFEFTQIQMGMPFRIALYSPDREAANGAAGAAYARIRQLNAILSDYEPESELMRLCRTAGQGMAIPVSRDLLAVLVRAQALSRLSGGAFDVSVGPLVRVWRKARRSGKMPAAEEIAAARAIVGHSNIRIDEAAGTVELLRKGMQLDLGGIAAGYAVDEALRVLTEHGVESALVDASGDIGVSGAPPGAAGWRIGIAPLEPDGEPSRYTLLKHAAVTTSGDAFQFVEIDGRRYSHIVDPQTGFGLTTRASVCVIARDCATADSYATAVSVLETKRGLGLIEEIEGAAVVIVRATGGGCETFESRRLREYLDPAIGLDRASGGR
ncbi:MAG: FAD:protein FMN transferase [Planctomycetaceae bacterium]